MLSAMAARTHHRRLPPVIGGRAGRPLPIDRPAHGQHPHRVEITRLAAQMHDLHNQPSNHHQPLTTGEQMTLRHIAQQLDQIANRPGA